MPNLAYSLPLALPGRRRAAGAPTPAGWKSVFQMRWGGGMLSGATGQTAWKTFVAAGRPTDGVSIIGRPPNR